MTLLYWKGRLLPPRKVNLSPLNTGLFFGESLFETLPVYQEGPLFFPEHLARLKKGCGFLRWPFLPVENFKKAIRLFRSELGTKTDFLIRFNLVQEMGDLSRSGASSNHRPELFAVTRSLRHDPDRFLPFSGKVGVSPWKAMDSETVPNHFKIPFYLTTRSVLREHPHWDEILRLNSHGQVVDGGSSTPMWFDGRTLFVPPLKLGGLESVTRERILHLCADLGLPAREKPWKPEDVFQKGELLFVGSGVGVMGASHLLGRRIKSSGFLAIRLWQHYRKWARERVFLR
jgi:branched-subunit amino acid aminotransferase/4-amino-4-deoxychorismate lyase